MRTVLLGTTAFLLLFVAASSDKPHTPSLNKLAGQVERLNVIPTETREVLARLIQRVNNDAEASNYDGRSAMAVARIEKAMQLKPIK